MLFHFEFCSVRRIIIIKIFIDRFCFSHPDPSIVETLLPEHEGTYLCCRQQRSWPCCWSQGRSSQDIERGPIYIRINRFICVHHLVLTLLLFFFPVQDELRDAVLLVFAKSSQRNERCWDYWQAWPSLSPPTTLVCQKNPTHLCWCQLSSL